MSGGEIHFPRPAQPGIFGSEFVELSVREPVLTLFQVKGPHGRPDPVGYGESETDNRDRFEEGRCEPKSYIGSCRFQRYERDETVL